MKRFLILTAFVTLAFIASGCSESNNDSSEAKQTQTINSSDGKTVPARVLKWEIPNRIKAGEKGTLRLTVEPTDADVTITCDSTVLQLEHEPQKDGCGNWTVFYTAKQNGSFSLSANSDDKTDAASGVVYTELESISIRPETPAALDIGETVQLFASQSPKGANEKITWTSSDTDIATVSESGLVTAKKTGKATIIATATFYDEATPYDGETVVAAFVDVTVKGFFLSDTAFFLSANDTTVVEANIVGIDADDVSWASSDSNIFTVTPDPSNNKKASISYVSGASGEATLTATMGDKTATAKVYVAKWSIVALGDSIAAGYAPKAFRDADKPLEEPAMLEAYDKYVNRRKRADVNPNYVNKYCYSNVLYEGLTTRANYSVNSYAKTGDRTEHLLAKLREDFSDAAAGIKQGEILEAVKNADYITLCIGANDFLKNATADFLIEAGEGNDNEFFTTKYPAELERCFSGFKQNFDRIIGILTADGQKVFVMSVYSPYHYFTLDNLEENQRNTWVIAGWFKYIYTKGLLRLNQVTCEKLLELNAYIKSVADSNDNVYFVDVANNFSGTSAISKNDYPTYIHADPSYFKLETVRNAGLQNTVPVWFDPHPTIKGEEKIAGLFKDVFESATASD
jgi:lysophospholipase L1-like esterase